MKRKITMGKNGRKPGTGPDAAWKRDRSGKPAHPPTCPKCGGGIEIGMKSCGCGSMKS